MKANETLAEKVDDIDKHVLNGGDGKVCPSCSSPLTYYPSYNNYCKNYWCDRCGWILPGGLLLPSPVSPF